MSAHLVLSLDFELRWGVQDKLGDDVSRYRKNLEGVREVVPSLLELFRDRAVRATWATVGALACEGWDEYFARAPAWPRYKDPALAWNPAFRANDPEGRLYFAPDLVEAIRDTPGQELGSHTFSHVYMGEPGFVRRDALADGDAVNKLFRERWGLTPRSFVFPRNQVAFTDVLREAGTWVWRDNPTPFFWGATTSLQQSSTVRALRLLDGLVPLGKRGSPASGPHRASHFVRLNLPEFAWKAHVRRLARDAARLHDGEVLHLWWHPHNLGADPKGGAARLATLLDAVFSASPQIVSSTMADLAAQP